MHSRINKVNSWLRETPYQAHLDISHRETGRPTRGSQIKVTLWLRETPYQAHLCFIEKRHSQRRDMALDNKYT